MEKIATYISKIPLAKIVKLVGEDTVYAISEYGIDIKPNDLAKIYISLKGKGVFKSSDFLKSLIYAFDSKDLLQIGKSLTIKGDSENIRDVLLKKKWGNNDFSKTLLSFFHIE